MYVASKWNPWLNLQCLKHPLKEAIFQLDLELFSFNDFHLLDVRSIFTNHVNYNKQFQQLFHIFYPQNENHVLKPSGGKVIFHTITYLEFNAALKTISPNQVKFDNTHSHPENACLILRFHEHLELLNVYTLTLFGLQPELSYHWMCP